MSVWKISYVLVLIAIGSAQLDDPMRHVLPTVPTNAQSSSRRSQDLHNPDEALNEIRTFNSEVDTQIETRPEEKLLINKKDLPKSTSGKKSIGVDEIASVENNQRHEEIDNSKCAYTFVISKDRESCVASAPPVTSQSRDDNQFLVELQRDVFIAKTQIEEMRNEIFDETKELPSARTISSIQRDVSQLQREVLVLNNRAQQINLQVSEQIVSRRDNTIELQQLENKLLNQTVQYYKLKDEHEQLKNDHNALRAKIIDQSKQLESLRTAVEKLMIQKKLNMNQVIPIQATQAKQTSIKNSWRESATSSQIPPGPFKDCTKAQYAGHTKSGIFKLQLQNQQRKIKVWCNFDQDPGGWITIQRRVDDKLDFYKDMRRYKKGFGKLRKNFWLGLENIHKLTNQSEVNYKLHIDLEDWEGRRTFVEYRSFRVEGEADGYKLKIAHYSGNAGDALTAHNNMKFTTRDEDNDIFHQNCAEIAHGGWWYTACGYSNLNGFYYREGEYRRDRFDGIYWSEWKGRWYSLKSVSMKIRPTE